jgi:hypothetical protein
MASAIWQRAESYYRPVQFLAVAAYGLSHPATSKLNFKERNIVSNNSNRSHARIPRDLDTPWDKRHPQPGQTQRPDIQQSLVTIEYTLFLTAP